MIRCLIASIACANALNMVMVAHLGQTLVIFEADNLFPVLAKLTVHVVVTVENAAHPFFKSIEHPRMIVQIVHLDEIDVRVLCRNFIGNGINTVHQNASKKEIGKYDDAFVAELHGVFQSWCHQREGYTGIAYFCPAETNTFPQHTANFIDFAVGIWIGSATPHHHKQGVFHRNIAACCFQSSPNTRLRRLQHFRIDIQGAGVADLQPRIVRFIFIEHGSNVIFHMVGGKQHAGHGQDMVHPLIAEGIQTRADNRCREFQKSVFHWIFREPFGELDLQGGEFSDCFLAPATVTTDHYADFTHAVSKLRKFRDWAGSYSVKYHR